MKHLLLLVLAVTAIVVVACAASRPPPLVCEPPPPEPKAVRIGSCPVEYGDASIDAADGELVQEGETGHL